MYVCMYVCMYVSILYAVVIGQVSIFSAIKETTRVRKPFKKVAGANVLKLHLIKKINKLFFLQFAGADQGLISIVEVK